MKYTILSVQYANEERTAAVAITEESAAVLLDSRDAEAWAQALEHGIDVYVPAPAQPKRVTSLEFIERFTEAEQIAIVTAAMQSPALRLWYDKLMAAQEVVFDDPRLVAGLAAMVGAGLLSEERAAEVLS